MKQRSNALARQHAALLTAEQRISFAVRLRARRKACGLSQLGIARAMGKTRPTYMSWENGFSFPNAENWEKLCAVLSCTRDDLMKGSEAV